MNKDMKTIKDLTVRMTFRVRLANVIVSDNVFCGLKKIADNGELDDSDVHMTKDQDIIEAWEWLGSNTNSDDAFNWEYEIEDLEESKKTEIDRLNKEK